MKTLKGRDRGEGTHSWGWDAVLDRCNIIVITITIVVIKEKWLFGRHIFSNQYFAVKLPLLVHRNSHVSLIMMKSSVFSSSVIVIVSVFIARVCYRQCYHCQEWRSFVAVASLEEPKSAAQKMHQKQVNETNWNFNVIWMFKPPLNCSWE